jgi:SAM-dependent methyltransferase
VDERGYTDPRLASLYDAMNPWGPSDDFYLELIRSARSVLDLGCGTGLLLRAAVAEGHAGRLVGVDPAAAMLAEARRDPAHIAWIEGDARTVDLGERFELAIMANHAFQVLLTDEDVRAVLENVQRHLGDDGRFAFETRNPAVKEWEGWTPEQTKRSGRSRDGERVDLSYRFVQTVEHDVIEVEANYEFEGASAPIVGTELLRFIDPAHLRSLLEASGFRIDGWFSDWDRSALTDLSREVIIIAVRD